MFYAYVIKSEKDGRLYKGSTKNIEHRLLQHNNGKVFSTKGFRPWKLVYIEKIASRELALKRETDLKSGSGREFLRGLGL